MKYKSRRVVSGFVKYYAPTTIARILYLLTSSVFFVSSVAFHYILTMPFIRVWYVIFIVYFRDDGISQLMENMKDGIEMC